MTETQGCLTWPCGCKQAPTAPVDEYTFRCEQHGGRPTAGSVRVSLASWLLERIADEETVAHEAARQAFFDATEGQPQVNYAVWPFGKIAVSRNTYTDLATCVLSPARVLAECAARRKIVALHSPHQDDVYDYVTCGVGVEGWRVAAERAEAAEEQRPVDEFWSYPCRTLRLLAAPYATEPGYRAEWTVSP